MILFILRRLGWAVVTIFGVMVITFMLFRVVSRDIAAANLGEKATEQAKARWRQAHGYDLPMLANFHRRLVVRDNTKGQQALNVQDVKGSGSNVVNALALILTVPQSDADQVEGQEQTRQAPNEIVGRYVMGLSADTPVSALIEDFALTDKSLVRMPAPATSPASASAPAGAAASMPSSAPTAAPAARAAVVFSLADGTKLPIDLTGAKTAGDILQRINGDAANQGKLEARISDYNVWSKQKPYLTALDSQFFHHLYESATFNSRDLRTNQLLINIIKEKGPYSLSITVPAMAFEFMVGLAIACLVAYFRGRPIDKIGVFMCVLGMCVPFLAFMIYGQWFMFKIAPRHAFGIFYRANVYLPIAIMTVASLGGMVRFYRAVILDETNRDYVRTARAKGLSLPSILFKHVLRNCMLPILTNLVLTIPFLIMGSLLVESFFSIPGLGDLMITSITSSNEPIISGLVFLTAVVYSLGVLVTDVCYAIFDPRIRLG